MKASTVATSKTSMLANALYKYLVLYYLSGDPGGFDDHMPVQ